MGGAGLDKTLPILSRALISAFLQACYGCRSYSYMPVRRGWLCANLRGSTDDSKRTQDSLIVRGGCRVRGCGLETRRGGRAGQDLPELLTTCIGLTRLLVAADRLVLALV